MQETLVRFLGQEDPLEKGMAAHSSILAWKIPWTAEPGRLCGVAKSRTLLSDFTFLYFSFPGYIMRNAGLDEAQAGIKIAGRNINNLRYADDTTLMAGNKEELKNLLMKMTEESEKPGLNSTFKKLRLWHPVPSLHGK